MYNYAIKHCRGPKGERVEVALTGLVKHNLKVATKGDWGTHWNTNHMRTVKNKYYTHSYWSWSSWSMKTS